MNTYIVKTSDISQGGYIETQTIIADRFESLGGIRFFQNDQEIAFFSSVVSVIKQN